MVHFCVNFLALFLRIKQNYALARLSFKHCNSLLLLILGKLGGKNEQRRTKARKASIHQGKHFHRRPNYFDVSTRKLRNVCIAINDETNFRCLDIQKIHSFI